VCLCVIEKERIVCMCLCVCDCVCVSRCVIACFAFAVCLYDFCTHIEYV
jgi:hypothetical protein